MSRWMTLFVYCITAAAVTWIFDMSKLGVSPDGLHDYLLKVLGCAGGLLIHWGFSK